MPQKMSEVNITRAWVVTQKTAAVSMDIVARVEVQLTYARALRMTSALSAIAACGLWLVLNLGGAWAMSGA